MNTIKKLALISALATSLVVSAQAVIIGVSAGYLVDAEESFFAVRVGGVMKETDTVSHQGEFEIGFVRDSDLGATIKLIPVMVNYRAEFKNQSPWGAFLGLGAGFTQTKVSGFGLSDDDWAPSLQGFAGVGYQAGPSTRITLGARYLWIGNAELFGLKDKVGDDVAIELGVNFRF